MSDFRVEKSCGYEFNASTMGAFANESECQQRINRTASIVRPKANTFALLFFMRNQFLEVVYILAMMRRCVVRLTLGDDD